MSSEPALSYTFKRNSRSKSVRISVRRTGEVLVTAPRRASKRKVDAFVVEKSAWIKNNLEKFAAQATDVSDATHEKYKDAALERVARLLEEVNAGYGFSWIKVQIRNQSTRWGSCSSRGTLCFNWKIALLPEHLARYIVVHELCHLEEMNHGPRFWKLVKQAMPEYEKAVRELRSVRL